VHPEPDRAPCDGLCQLRIEDMDRLLAHIHAIAAVVSPSGEAKV
jgi:3-deoxy-D-manno-octulosonic acid (KDO) 8-phosphate synthase